MKRLLVLLLILAMCVIAPTAFAGTNVVKPGEDFVYLDQADVLSDATKGEIYFANKQLFDKNGSMIVVVVMNNLGGENTYDYAYDLYNEWGIGGSKEDNGFLLLMAIKEDDYYALPGAGLEDVFSSGKLKNLMDEYLEPDFARKDYDAGARKFFEAVYEEMAAHYGITEDISDAVAAYQDFIAETPAESAAADPNEARYNTNKDFGERTVQKEAPRQEKQQPRRKEGGSSLGIIVLILIILLIIAIVSKSKGGSFLFWRPTFFWPIFGPRVYPTGWQQRRPPQTPGGFAGPGPVGGFNSRPAGGFTAGRPTVNTPRSTGGFTRSFGSTPRSSGTTSRPTVSTPRSTGSTTRSTGSSSSRSLGSGLFGGLGRSSGSSRSGGSGRSGFGGGFSGGGRSFGGGAGRGRH